MAASTTEAAPLRAFSSPLVEADGDGDGAYFGYEWLEIVRGARGFSIRVDTDYGTGICKITNLAPEVVDAVAASDDARLQFVQSGGLHHFLLLPGEYVTRVDVSSDGECILALRFVTTLRSSQWYGRTGVTAATTTSLVAPDGFIIKLLQGTQDDMRCLQLGVLYSPLATEPALDATPSGSVAFSGLRIPRAKHADHILDKPFKRFSPTMRAVVVNCVYDRVTSVHVLSASEFACYEATSEKLLRVVATEHFFVLVEGERMTGVACHYAKGGGVAGIRFRTTRRTSLWFGCMPYGQEVAPAWYPTEIRDGAYVCGFHGVETDDKLRAIGPVFFTPTRDATRLSAKGAVASGAA